MITKLQSLIIPILRDILFRKKRWCKPIITMLLFVLFSSNSYAGDISPESTSHYSVEWDKDLACYKFKIRVYDYAYDDNWASYFRISARCSGINDIIFVLDTHQQNYTNPGDVSVKVKNTRSDNEARLFAQNARSGWTKMLYKNVPFVLNQSTTEANGYYTHKIIRTNGEANHIELYWYPGAKYMNRNITFNLTGMVRDSKGKIWNKDVSRNAIYSTPWDYSAQVSDAELNKSTGAYDFTVSVSNVNKYRMTNSQVNIQTSLDGKNWNDRKDLILSSTLTSSKITDSSLLKYKDKSNKVLLSADEWTNGIYIRAVSNTSPDGTGNGAGSSPYVQQSISPVYFFGGIASMKSTILTISQNNRDLDFKWDVNTKNNYQSQENSYYAVERHNGKSWMEIAKIDHVDNQKSYSYRYTLKDEECNKGNIDYKFRVRKKVFNEDFLWAEFLNSTVTKSINTDYKTVKITSIDAVGESTNALIKWSTHPIDNGLWDENAKLQIFKNGVKIADPLYQDGQFVVGSLQGCRTYEFQISVTALNKRDTTEVVYFDMPDSRLRDIESFEASKGYYNNTVMLSWSIPSDKSNFDYFAVTRTPISGGSEVTIQQIIHTGLTDYSYNDQSMDAGELYSYKITGYSKCESRDNDGNIQETLASGVMKTDVGYCQPYGIISGRIAFDGSQGVSGVTVSVSGNEDNSKNKSLYFNSSESQSFVTLPADVIDLLNYDKFTFQGWVFPLKQKKSSSYIVSKNELFELRGYRSQGSESQNLSVVILGKTLDTSIKLEESKWSQITCCIDINKVAAHAKCYIYVDGEIKHTSTITDITIDNLSNTAYLAGKVIIGAKANSASYSFDGYVDELRFWNKCLDEATVKSNFNAYISGKDENLRAYYRCDEAGVDQVFDISGKGTRYNKRNGTLGRLSEHSDFVPSFDQLSNKTVTDADGNYLLNTIPYTTDGLQYNIIPTLGTHKFNPSKRPVYISPASTTFNSVDYVDESSFNVSGKVYYEGTLYPVEGVSFYVDGVICSRNGEVIKSGSDGSYEISVPIGEHFIQAKLNGHEFLGNGRYPADDNNIKLQTFTNDVKDLYFYDNTTVTVAGRVVGGNIEFDKPLGMALSINNIGKAAVELTAGTYQMNVNKNIVNGIISFDPNPSNKNLNSVTSDVKNTAYISGGKTIDDTKTIVIITDSLTGEFAVKLPPVEYSVKSVKVESNKDISFDISNISNIDATNVQVVNTDSITLENGNYKEFDYTASMKLKYQSDPIFNVIDMGNNVGAFGEKTLSYKDVTMTEPLILNAYEVDENDKVNYLISSSAGNVRPVFLQNDFYDFKIEAFEEYSNKDNNEFVTYSKVPLQGTIVTITNTMSASQKVYVESGTADNGQNVNAGDLVELEENQLVLDSIGTATYRWRAGFPNIVAPYERGLNIVYNYNGEMKPWSESNTFAGIVLGNLPTGNNFVTTGPDKVLMVLRDPPGTNSKSFWEEGITLTTEEMDGGSIITNNEVVTSTSFGLYGTTIVGTPGFGVINEVGQKNTLEIGVEVNANYSNSKTWITTITTTKNISTSDEYDFVGAHGDLFIGSATNIIFGNARQVGLVKKDNSYLIGLEDVITTGSEFSTSFNYTTYYIESYLIPNLIKIRNSKLTTVDESTYNSFVNNTDEVVYLTKLSPDDEKYGSRNFDKSIWGNQANKNKATTEGPSYKMVLPVVRDPKTAYQDMILWHNEQILGWENTLADNEAAKYDAIENRSKWLDQNYSFDAGAILESSTANCSSESRSHEREVETLAVLGLDTGFEINKIGISVSAVTKTGAKYFGNTTNTTENCITTGYVFKDENAYDAFTVDVFKAPDGFGSIFRTRGGQTSCPFEGEIVTNYFKPGYVLSEATMQIDMPQLSVVEAYAVDVPSGKAATYTIKLDNISEIDVDSWYDLALVEESNPNGAVLSIDGATLTTGRSVVVKAGETLSKTLQLKQSRSDIMDYENIKVVLKSQCQSDPTSVYDVIADTISISAYFVPSCTDITLQIEDRVMNTYTSDTLNIQVKDYDKTFNNLKAIRIQYKGERDIDWKLVKEYVLSESDLNNNNAMLPDGGKLSYKFPMSNKALYPDQNYTFRAVTACMYGNDEIQNESNTIDVIKDMAKPLVLGKPSPANGVVSGDSEISLMFNESIKNSSLSKVENFSVTGRLNGYRIDHQVALKLQGDAASTQADIDLSSKDFTIEMWVKLESAGEILSHGNGESKFIISTDVNGKLNVKIGNKDYVSANNIPMNKWIFLYCSYENNDVTGILTSYYASGAEEKVLFDGNGVVRYSGNGRLKVGNGIKGAMHALSLWNNARSFVDAKYQMYLSKSASTPNLIGYWNMEEGRGDIAKDNARYRHLTIPASNSWHIEADNYSVNLTGDQYVALNTSLCPVTTNEDCMIEMWFRTGMKDDKSTLFSINDTVLAVRLDKDGKVELIASGNVYTTVNQGYSDNAWHHLAMNIHRNGNSILYIDGKPIKQISTTNVSDISTDRIILGARRYRLNNSNQYGYADYLTGNIDEFRLWKARLTADMISENIYNRLSGDEDGLVAYYPFEEKGLDSGNQVIINPSYEDKSSTNTGEAYRTSGVSIEKDAPALKENITLSNVDFSFVASENKIVINVNESDERIENCTLFFTVKDVRDINNNLSLPVSWSAYVNRNNLKWEKELVSVKSEASKGTSFDVVISNMGSESENWTLSNLPSWLSTNETSGTLRPLSEKTIKFNVNNYAAIGKYEESIYLNGNKNINERLTVSLHVTGAKPDWTVDASKYELSMNLIGQLQVIGEISQDEDDIIAAFIKDECVGVASPKYFDRYDTYYTLMDIYNNSENSGENVEFRIWDSGTGNIYPIVTISENIIFANNQLYGSFNTPIIMNARDMIEQRIDLNKGWNWTSIFVNNEDGMSLNNMFKNIVSFTEIVKGKSSFAVTESGSWVGSLIDVSVNNMYKVKTTNNGTLKTVGKKVTPSMTPITVNKGWNWIGYTPTSSMGINYALAGLNPKTGDIIKAQKGFATYDGYEWVGSLAGMQPGSGYLYNSTSVEIKDFTYPNSAPKFSRKLMNAFNAAKSLESDVFEVVSDGEFSGNMTMICMVYDNNEPLKDIQVGVFCKDQCRGAIKSDPNGLLFLTVAGEGNNDKLTFKVMNNNVMSAVDQGLVYSEDAIHGSFNNPYIINLSPLKLAEANSGIKVYPTRTNDFVNVIINGEDVSLIEVNDISGVKLYETALPNNNVTIDFKDFEDGVYFINILESNGHKSVFKIVKY